MLFCTKQFLLFFSIVFTLYWMLPWTRVRVWLLLVASFYFYASWNKWLALLICISTTVDYLLAHAMQSSQSDGRRKAMLATSLIGNLGLLFYFKYANFFLQSLQETLRVLGANASIPLLSVVLPVGISFYTFEAISYTVDVYRRRIPAERNLANFMLFILFFPHLVAGPIVRGGHFLPQVQRPKRWSWMRLQLGTEYLLMGFFKKAAIADRMPVFVDPVFAEGATYTSSACWLAVLAYTLQIYCDFSGYSDMAIGSAHLVGYKLPKNFHMPYGAPNISEFWRRWHISLSNWLRDYVFMPLGGSRRGRTIGYFNLLLTMGVCGLWHGANWTFVVFGVLHGAWLTVHRIFQGYCRRHPLLETWLTSVPGTVCRIGATVTGFGLTLVVFRAATLHSAVRMLGRLFIPHTGYELPMPATSLLWFAVGVAVCHIAVLRGAWRAVALQMPTPVLGFGYALVLALALMLATDTTQPFIYFQF